MLYDLWCGDQSARDVLDSILVIELVLKSALGGLPSACVHKPTTLAGTHMEDTKTFSGRMRVFRIRRKKIRKTCTFSGEKNPESGIRKIIRRPITNFPDFWHFQAGFGNKSGKNFQKASTA
jgi:hypothetical protein